MIRARRRVRQGEERRTDLGVVFLQEVDDADVVLEGDDMRFRKAVKGGHVC